MAIEAIDIDFEATEAFHNESPDADSGSRGPDIDFEATDRY